MSENFGDQLVQGPYEPFPSFSKWARSGPDLSYIDQLMASFEVAREAADATVLQAVVDQATREAAVDTGALEGLYDVDRGFTFSVAKSAAAWENIREVKGHQVERTIRDHLAGYELVLDLATTRRPITESIIKNLHAVLCASQDTYQVLTEHGMQDRELVKGEYKREFNNPKNRATGKVHSYAPPMDVIPEMHRLVEELRSERFQEAHPVLQTSYAHYAFVCIHPFPDGNGRVSRALASAFSYRRPGIPLVIFADQKGHYIDALESADAGDFAAFATFVGDRIIDAVQTVTDRLRRAERPSLQDRVRRELPDLQGPQGRGHAEIDAIADRVLDAAMRQFDKAVGDAGFEPPLSANRYTTHGQLPDPPAGFRHTRATQHPVFSVTVDAPGNAAVAEIVSVGVRRPGSSGPDLALVLNDSIVLELFLREVDPVLSTSFGIRLEAAVEDALGDLVEEVSKVSRAVSCRGCNTV